MKRKQKAVLAVGIVLVVLMAVFPPWKRPVTVLIFGVGRVRTTKFEGYSLASVPPRRLAGVDSDGQKYWTSRGTRVDTRRLVIQCLAVALWGVGSVYSLQDRKRG